MNKNYLLGALIIIVLAFFLFGGPQSLSLENIQQHRDALQDFTARHYVLMLIGCGIVYTLSTAFSVPGGTVLSLLLGFLFGRWAGTLLIVCSATLGATAVFWLARYLFADRAEQRLRGNAVAQKIIDGFQTDAFNYLLFLRLIPLFPFWLVNIAPAFTHVSLRTYVVTTAVGIIPGSFVYANLGQSLGNIKKLDQLLSFETLLAFTLLGVLSLAPVAVKYYKIRQESERP
ncbi:MAG: TVP38/TMEM64 family protein [Gammaproteobacteria bacterium]